MRKSQTNLIILNAVFCTCLIIANVVSSKVVNLGFLTIPAAVVAYPWTFLCTDVIGQIWGKAEANKTVKIGIATQILSLILIYISILLPEADYMKEFQIMFKNVLGSSWKFVAASLVAYCASQSWDVWVFHKIKNMYEKKTGSAQKNRWIWNNASTMTSQIIDTAIFITIAFAGAVPNLLAMILSQYFVKFIIALLDTPLFYILTRKREETT